MNIKESCPICEETNNVKQVTKQVDFEIRKEKISLNIDFYYCSDCNEYYEDSDKDMMNLAFKKYREIHGMMQPEKIKEIRKKYGLTQEELSKLLGFGAMTLSRYENGSLQDKTHDNSLQFIKNPQNLLSLVNNNNNIFSKKKFENLIMLIKKEINCPINELNNILGREIPNILTGFKKFNANKLINLILYFCKDEINKTKLNKLLFYSDFLHFKNYNFSISGLAYAHLPYGPVPDRFDTMYEILIKNKNITENIEINEEYYKITYNTNKKYDLSIFTEEELEIIINIKKFFKNYSPSQITVFSHKEKGYLETNNSELISYDFAKYLNI